MKPIGKLVTALLTLLVTAGSSLALAEVQASLDRDRIAFGDTLRLTITATDNDGLDEIDLEPLNADFEVLGSSFSSNTSISLSRRSENQQLVLDIAPRREGNLRIPSLRVGSENTAAIPVVVGPAPELLGSDETVLFEIEVDRDRVYVQSQFILTLRVQQSINLERRGISELKLDNAFVKPLQQRDYRRTIDGRPWLVNEVRYAIFPEQSGTLEIPAQVFSGRTVPARRSLFDRGRDGQLVRRSTRPLVIEVLPKPEAFTAPTWLPVSDLTVEENWSTPPEELRVGESATRTITIKGTGAQGAQLPPIHFTPTDGLKFYPDQPHISEEEVASGLLGIREDSAAMVPTRTGSYLVPEIRIPWWDVQSEQVRYAVVPARRIDIKAAAPAANPEPSPSPAPTLEAADNTAAPGWQAGSLLWPILAATSSAGWLLTLVYLWRLRRPRPDSDGREVARDASEKKAFKQLLAACATGEPSEARAAVIAWAGTLEQERQPVSLEQVSELFGDDALSRELERLDAALFSPGGGNWSGSTLSGCLDTLRRKRRGASKKTASPLRLYPASEAN